MKINNFHAMYLTSHPILEFLRAKGIRCSGYLHEPEHLKDAVNKAIEDGLIDEDEMDETLFDWLYQGRRKIILRYLTDTSLQELNKDGKLVEVIKEKFPTSEVIKGLKGLRVTNDKFHLVDIWYYHNSENEDIIDKVVLVFVEMLIYKPKDTTYTGDIPYPVFVTLDLVNNEVSSRVPAKVSIYDKSGHKAEDIDIAKAYLRHVLLKLGIPDSVSESEVSCIEKMFYNLHTCATELPEEIIDRAEEFKEEIMAFIEKMQEKLKLKKCELFQDEIYNNIKDIIIKQIIRTYGDKDEFEKDKDVISIGINASGSSLSRLNYNAPGNEPVQATPEYQNIKSVLSETERIGRNILLWKTDPESNKFIRSKFYIHSDGYGVVSFEQYVFEEDIQYVLSKIRGFKPGKGIY